MDPREPPNNAPTSPREREQRTRYEVLRMLYDAARRAPGGEVQAWGFAGELGVWYAEVFRAVDFLDREGLIEYLGAGPLVRISRAGMELIESGAEHPGLSRGDPPTG